MLKIKDNVDLKELEKYGFEPYYNTYTGEICEYHLYSDNKIYVKITKEERKKFFDKVMAVISKNISNNYVIHFYDYIGLKAEKEDLLYDLIKANLVEKVGE